MNVILYNVNFVHCAICKFLLNIHIFFFFFFFFKQFIAMSRLGSLESLSYNIINYIQVM